MQYTGRIGDDKRRLRVAFPRFNLQTKVLRADIRFYFLQRAL